MRNKNSTNFCRLFERKQTDKILQSTSLIFYLFYFTFVVKKNYKYSLTLKYILLNNILK